MLFGGRGAAAEGTPAGLTVAEREAINPGLPTPPPEVKRTTPAASWATLLELCQQRRYPLAAHLLDLTEVRREEQRPLGSALAEKLCQLLAAEQVEALPGSQLSGEGEEGRNAVVVARLEHPQVGGEVWLRRTRDLRTGEEAWLVTRRTVASLPLWHAAVVEGRELAQQTPLNAGLGPAPPGLKRGSPREAVSGFLELAKRGEFATAAHFLDLSQLPLDEQPRRGAQAARRLLLVLVRQGWVKPAQLSNDPPGAPEQGVAEDRERVATVMVRGREVELTLQRRLDPGLGIVWTFSSDTVAEVGALYRAFGYGVIGDHLPLVFFSYQFGGLQLWQWAALGILVALGWGLGWGIGHWAVSLVKLLARRTQTSWDDLLAHTLDGPLGIVLWGAFLSVTAPWVGLEAASFKITHTLFRLLILVGLAWLLLRIVDAVTGHMRRAAGPGNFLALGFIPILSKVLKALVLVLGILAALDTVGVNVMAVLAGLGLGGLAIAFAAQKTIENLFGAVAIAGDRPFQVGDFVSIGDVTGTVEDVGLRSTRLRTLQRTLVTIPNSAVAAEKVTNFSARDRMLYNPLLGLVYGTTVEQLTYVLDEIRKLLLSHPRVFQELQRVRFRGFGAYALEVEVVAWVETRDFVEFTALAEELNFAIARIVAASGSAFAFPSQTLYLGWDAGIDHQRAAEVAKIVAQRRAAGELAVPEPSAELRAALRPPEGGNGAGI